MNECKTHPGHEHTHHSTCGHTAIEHQGHTDYLHDGCLHYPHGDHVDEHVVEISEANPAQCTADHMCEGQEKGHVHGTGCGHESVPHGDHSDYLVGDHLHYVHGDHCDDHGSITVRNG